MRTDAQQGIILNVVVGIVGAFIGGLVFTGGSINSAPLTVTSFLVSLVGAIVLLAIVNLVRRGSVRADQHAPYGAAKRGRRRSRRGPFYVTPSSKLDGERDGKPLLACLDAWCPAAFRRAPSSSAWASAVAFTPPCSMIARIRLTRRSDASGHRVWRAPAPCGSPPSAPSSSAASGLSIERFGPLILLAPSAHERVEDRARALHVAAKADGHLVGCLIAGDDRRLVLA